MFRSDSLSEEVISMLRIKASMYANGDVSQYVKDLIQKDRRPIPDIEAYCASCHTSTKMKAVSADEVFYVKDQAVNVREVPKYQCTQCGCVTTNVKLAAAIEEALEVRPSLLKSGTSLSFESLV